MNQEIFENQKLSNPLKEIFPTNWSSYQLQEIIDDTLDFRGKTPRKLGMEWGNGDIPALSANNVEMGRINLYKETYYASEKLDQKWMNKGDVKKGDIIITMEAPLGNIAQIPDNRRYILSQRVLLIKTKENLIHNGFIKHYMMSSFFQSLLRQDSTGTTATGIQQAKLIKLSLFIPPLPEQHRIAEILDTIDEAIARTDSLIQKLKLMKAGLLNDLLTCGLDENGELRDPIKHPEQFKDSVLGRIPREWEVKNLGEACSLIKDGSHLPPKRVEKGVLLLSVQNMINGRLQLTDLDTRVSWDFYKTMHKNWTIQVGDILLAIVGATIGKTAVVPFSFPKFTLQRSVAILRGQQGLLENSFLRLYLSSDKFQKIIWHRVNQTAQPGIYLAELAGFKIPAPTTEEQKKIFNIIDTHDTRIRTEETYLNKLKRQKQGLMHDLLTGKVRVT
jgi:type I restriction enzyme S subunit